MPIPVTCALFGIPRGIRTPTNSFGDYCAAVTPARYCLASSEGIEPSPNRVEACGTFRYATRTMFGAECGNRTRLTSLEDLDTTNMPTPRKNLVPLVGFEPT